MLLSPNWQARDRATLTYLLRQDEVLLIHKRRGHGAGKVNAPGGHLERAESPAQCSIREVREEVGVRINSQQLKAILRFHDAITDFRMLGYVFDSTDFTGSPIETTEARPFWSFINEIPFKEMWEDDEVWLPLVLNNRFVQADFIFNNDNLASYSLQSECTNDQLGQFLNLV